MPEPMNKLTHSLLFLLLALPAMAQESVDATEEQEIRRYTVEIIVFKYAQDVSGGSEVFLGDKITIDETPLQEDLEILDPRPPEPQEVEEKPGQPLPDIELILLQRNDYQLNDIKDMLRRVDAYEPIMHFGWTQATWPEEETEALPLYRFAEPPAGLDGSLKLYLSRYLHLVVDLQLDAPGVTSMSQDEVEQAGDIQTVGDLLGYASDQPQRGPVRYHIEENRILKNGELRYYDHPKFGVLAKVTRVEQEEEDPEESELLGYGTE
jgi:hypothetical protein